MKKINSFHQSGERYPSLRVIASFFTVIGMVLMASGALLLAFGINALARGTGATPPQGGVIFAGPQENVLPLAPGLSATVALVWSFPLLLSGLQVIAHGTLFRLMIHLEENTRATAQVLDKFRSRLESSPEGVESVFRA